MKNQFYLVLYFLIGHPTTRSSHIKLCLTLGRGQPDFEPRTVSHLYSLKRSPLGDANDRLTVFRAIAFIVGRTDEANRTSCWPLSLPSVHQALINASLTSDPITRSRNALRTSAERFLCDSVITAVAKALTDPSSITNLMTLRGGKTPAISSSDEPIPLSLVEARIIVLAALRLPRREMVMIFSKLVGILHSFLVENHEKKDGTTKGFTKPSFSQDLSSFVARLITTIASLADTMRAGSRGSLIDLSRVGGPTHFQLPSFVISEVNNNNSEIGEKDEDGDSAEDCDWYCRETCFMGIFSDWENSSLPAVGEERESSWEPLPANDVVKFSSILEAVFELGMESARFDRCHLLFAAWNTSARMRCWQSDSLALSSSKFNQFITQLGPSHTIKEAKRLHAHTIIAIRDNLCEIYALLGQDPVTLPDTFLTKVLGKQRITGGVKVHANSGNGVDTLKRVLMEFLIYLPSSIDGPMSSCRFVMFEAMVCYVSFLISMFTSSDSDFLSSYMKRESKSQKVKYTSVSGDSLEDEIFKESSDESRDSDEGSPEPYHDFEEEEDEEVKLDSLSHLHQSCVEIGAAPFHPDWLDKATCRLRKGLSVADAVNSAASAVSALTSFGSTAFRNYTKAIHRVVQLTATGDKPDETNIALMVMSALSNKIGSHTSSSLLSPVGPDNWKKDLADVCSVELGILEAITSKLNCKNRLTAQEAFVPNSAHRIKGRLQEFVSSIDGWEVTAAEYRAGGEWELMLSETVSNSLS